MTEALAYAVDAPPELGVPTEIAPGVLWLRMSLPFALDHINLWLLEDDDGLVAVDTGLGDPRTRAIWDGLLARLRISRILVTHYHPDHFGNGGWLAERTGADLHMSEREWLFAHAVRLLDPDAERAARTAWYRRHGLDGPLLEGLERPRPGYAQGVPTLPARYRRIRPGDVWTIAGRRWEMRLGLGHAPEQILPYRPDDGVLIAGDQVLPRISPNIGVWPQEPEADPLEEFLASLADLARLPADTLVLPSHGLPFRGLRPRIAELAAHHAARLDDLAAACAAAPRTMAELMRTLFDRPLDPQQAMFAFAETAAHANRLLAEGRLVWTGPAEAPRLAAAHPAARS